jgi:8-oxo-dGTP diphosphatase
LIKVQHRYPDLQVLLDVWNVESFSGEVRGLEGQPIRWVSPEQLPDYAFPAANRPIIAAARLPRFYAIVEARTETQMLTDLTTVLNNGVKLVQLRLKSPLANGFSEQIILKAISKCREQNAQVLLNSGWARIGNYATIANGLHLTSADLLRLDTKPEGKWIAASCHDEPQLRKAEALGVDFVVIAPVQATETHPNAMPLGWEHLQALIDGTHLPVFALGGLASDDVEKAIQTGAQGIAGIRAFLSRC